MTLTDSHAHLDMYSDDLPEVLVRARVAGVGMILAIGIGDGPDEMQCALEIVAEYSGRTNVPKLYASAGIHPQEAHRADAEALDKLARLAADERVIAVGEIGLDYYHVDNPEPAVQRAAFVAQMQIASSARKPILIHCRTSEMAKPEAKAKFGDADAWTDLLELLGEHWSLLDRGAIPAGILHCFSGTIEQAQRSLEMGFYLSFAGNLTYPKAVALRDVAAFVPAHRLLIETDAPFLAPVPLRGQRNEPALVAHTAACMAQLRSVSPEELATITTANFQRLFATIV
jgi:TatD DNase family protein